MKNLIILTANVKGGVGKTVLSGVLANYLSQQGIPVAVVDADIQQSLYGHREREMEANPNAEIPWDVQSLANFDEIPVEDVMQNLKQIPGCIIIDCPGNIQDENLKHIYNAADIVVVPTRYDSDTVDATKRFLDVFNMVSDAKVFIVPNNIVLSDERRESVREERMVMHDILGDYGVITPRIKQSVIYHCYSTIKPLDCYQRNGVMYAFEPIIEAINAQMEDKNE